MLPSPHPTPHPAIFNWSGLPQVVGSLCPQLWLDRHRPKGPGEQGVGGGHHGRFPSLPQRLSGPNSPSSWGAYFRMDKGEADGDFISWCPSSCQQQCPQSVDGDQQRPWAAVICGCEQGTNNGGGGQYSSASTTPHLTMVCWPLMQNKQNSCALQVKISVQRLWKTVAIIY